MREIILVLIIKIQFLESDKSVLFLVIHLIQYIRDVPYYMNNYRRIAHKMIKTLVRIMTMRRLEIIITVYLTMQINEIAGAAMVAGID